MFLFAFLMSFIALTPSLALHLAPRTAQFTNTTSPTTATSHSSPVPSNCCFVVQDVVSEFYWQQYTQVTWTELVRITSITTLITPFADTIVTKYKTKVHASYKVLKTSKTNGYNPISLATNGAPQPAQVVSTILNGSHTVTAGVTVKSPAAFWIYSSVKIITVPVVTDIQGNLVCATASERTTTDIYTTDTFIPESTLTMGNGTSTRLRTLSTDIPTTVTDRQILTVTGVNSNAEAYFGGYNISTSSKSRSTLSISGYKTHEHTVAQSDNQTVVETKIKTIYAVTKSSVWIRTEGEIFVYTPPTTGTVITFPTPYVYFPPWGHTDGCSAVDTNGRFGYVPQSVINHMASNSAIKNQYPGIATCLPAGPSILRSTEECPTWSMSPPPRLPVDQQTVSELTSSTVTTVYGWESSYALDHPTTTANTEGSPTPLPSSGHLGGLSLFHMQPTPISQPSAENSGVTALPPDSTAVSVSPIGPWLSSIIASMLGIPQISTPPASPPSVKTPGIISIGGVPISIAAQNNNQPPAPPPITNNVPFPTTTISGSAFLELSPTTVPVIPGVYLPGQTTVLSDGSTYVIITAPTLIPVPPPPQPINPIPATIISGSTYLNLPPTTMPIIPGVSIPGQTVVFPDGKTEVIVTASTLIPLPPTLTSHPQPPYPFSTTIISGTTYLALSPTTMPLIPGISIPGQTTVLPDGETDVIITASTLIPFASLTSLPSKNTLSSPALKTRIATTTAGSASSVARPTTLANPSSTKKSAAVRVMGEAWMVWFCGVGMSWVLLFL